MSTSPTSATALTAVLPAAPAVAERHFISRLTFETDAADVARQLAIDPTAIVLVDARSAEAHAESHLPGALSLPHRDIDAAAVAALPAEGLVVTYCWGPGCNAATKAAARIAAEGRPVKEMIGGLASWIEEGHPVEGASADMASAAPAACC